MAAERRGALALALLLSAVAAAAVVPKRPPPPADDAAIVREAAGFARANDCAGVLRLLDPLVARTAPGTGDAVRVASQVLRMPCLGATGRGKEVPAVLAEVRAAAPDNPILLGYEIFEDAGAGRSAAAADRLARLADTGSPALRAIPGTLWRALAQQLTIAGDVTRRERTALALVRAGWTPADLPDIARTLLPDAIAATLNGPDADPDQAAALLARARDPDMLVQMAIETRYRPLWPAIEARLGPAGGTAADRFAEGALARFADTPDDDHARLEAARAFMALGRADDVIATAAPVAVATGMGEDRALTAIVDARARAWAGKPGDAIARLSPVATVDLATTPAATGLAIELAEYQHQAGRYADELATARDLIARGRPVLSAYGLQWARRDELCALAGLGRKDEAKAAGDAMVAAAADNPAAAIEGLLCAGRDGDAAPIAVRTLAGPDGGRRLADQFQPTAALAMASRSSLRDLWARLLARPDVRAAFDRAARILPRALWPAPTPRPLPAPQAPAGQPTA